MSSNCCLCRNEIGAEDAGHTKYGWLCVSCMECLVDAWTQLRGYKLEVLA